jgi:hypothetical protein
MTGHDQLEVLITAVYIGRLTLPISSGERFNVDGMCERRIKVKCHRDLLPTINQRKELACLHAPFIPSCHR